MAALSAVAGVSLILLMLFEAFETILLPRRVTRPLCQRDPPVARQRTASPTERPRRAKP